MQTVVRAEVDEPRLLVPGPASHPVDGLHACNNNLDACDFRSRRYLAWRTAPTHFASSEAKIHVVSTEDGEHWDLSGTIAMNCDIREPRFFVYRDRLFLFFFTLGTDWRRFEPDRIHMTILYDGEWSDPEPISATDCVIWRVRLFGSQPLMTVYRGAGRLYTDDPIPTTVEFWTSDDGRSWRSLDRRRPVAHVGGTETDIIEHPDSGWIIVTRKEGPTGFGSDIAHVKELTSADWRVRSVPEKLDSPCLFRFDNEVLLIARRTVEFGGAYDLQLPGITDEKRTQIYHRVYWATPKRTALWRIDKDTLDLQFIADLPGKGDTCFPAVVGEGRGFRVYNYSSPLDGMDLPWVAGQLGSSVIYDVCLRLGVGGKSG